MPWLHTNIQIISNEDIHALPIVCSQCYSDLRWECLCAVVILCNEYSPPCSEEGSPTHSRESVNSVRYKEPV